MIKVLLFCLMGVTHIQSQAPQSGETHFHLTNTVKNVAIFDYMDDENTSDGSGDTHLLSKNASDPSKYDFLDAEEKKLEDCDICKALILQLVKQLPKGAESEDHFSSVIHAACKEIQLPLHNCTEFVTSFQDKVQPIKS